jgi:hypothetical protein
MKNKDIVKEEPQEGVNRIMYYLYDFEAKTGRMVIVNEGSDLFNKLKETEKVA